MGKLYLVRHGRTAWNKGEVFRGTTGVPLDEVGREQAKLLGRALCEQAPNPIAVFCSPLSRATETASIVSEAFGRYKTSDTSDTSDTCSIPRPIPLPDLRFTDIDVGEWSGMALTDVETKYPGQYDAWVRTPHLVRFPGGQTLQEVQDQAWNGVESLVTLARENDVILVSHRLTLKTIILKAVGAGLEDFWSIRLDTASISILEMTSNGGGQRLTLSRLNDVSHLAQMRLPDRIDF